MPTITPIRTGVVVAAIYTALFRHGTLYGGQLIAATGFRSGSVYPALEKLLRAGILEDANDEDAAPAIDGRSKRREVYRYTDEGREWAINELTRLGLPIPTRVEASTNEADTRDDQPPMSRPRRR